MPKMYYLSEEDATNLKWMYEKLKAFFENPPSVTPPPEPDSQTPEVYVVLTPAGGIDPAIPNTRYGTGVGTGTPSEPLYTETDSSECDVYQVIKQQGVDELVDVGFKETVYSLSSALVGGNSWVLAVRDKFGKFFAVPTAVTTTKMIKVTSSTPDDPGTSTAAGQDMYLGVVTTWNATTEAWADDATVVRLRGPNEEALTSGTRYQGFYAGVDEEGVAVYIADKQGGIIVREADLTPTVTSVTIVTALQTDGYEVTAGAAGEAILTLKSASATQKGAIDTTTQTIAGLKSFTNAILLGTPSLSQGSIGRAETTLDADGNTPGLGVSLGGLNVGSGGVTAYTGIYPYPSKVRVIGDSAGTWMEMAAGNVPWDPYIRMRRGNGTIREGATTNEGNNFTTVKVSGGIVIDGTTVSGFSGSLG